MMSNVSKHSTCILLLALVLTMGLMITLQPFASAQQCVNPAKFQQCIEARQLQNKLLEGPPRDLTDAEYATLGACPEISSCQGNGQCIDQKKFSTCVEAKKILNHANARPGTRLTPEQLKTVNSCPEVITVAQAPGKPKPKTGINGLDVLNTLIQIAPLLMMPGGGGGTSVPCPTGH